MRRIFEKDLEHIGDGNKRIKTIRKNRVKKKKKGKKPPRLHIDAFRETVKFPDGQEFFIRWFFFYLNTLILDEYHYGKRFFYYITYLAKETTCVQCVSSNKSLTETI